MTRVGSQSHRKKNSTEVNVQPNATAALPPGKKPSVPIAQETGWPPEAVWILWRRDKFIAPAWIRNTNVPACSLAHILTMPL